MRLALLAIVVGAALLAADGRVLWLALLHGRTETVRRDQEID